MGGPPLSVSHYEHPGVKILRDNQDRFKPEAETKLNSLLSIFGMIRHPYFPELLLIPIQIENNVVLQKV